MIEKVAAAKARSIVDAAIAEAARTGMFPSSLAGLQESAAAALAMWSMMHGLTMLTIDDFVGPAEDIEIVADSMLGAMLDGIASNPPKLSRGRLVGTASLAKTPKAPPPGISRHAADGEWHECPLRDIDHITTAAQTVAASEVKPGGRSMIRI